MSKSHRMTVEWTHETRRVIKQGSEYRRTVEKSHRMTVEWTHETRRVIKQGSEYQEDS